MTEIRYSIKDLENFTQIKAHTIRIWESRYGLLTPSRTDTNIRYYGEEDLKKILNINLLYTSGLKISKIAALTELEIISNSKALILEEDTDKQSEIDMLTVMILAFDGDAIKYYLDERLEKYESKSSSAQLSELNQLATVFALVSVGEVNNVEPLVLELVNKGDNVQKDLLILLLAETQKNQGLIEQSLGYYGALISDYPQSPYLNRAIFEASELLGKLGHTEEQMSMLQALKESDGAYGEQARKKLE